MAALRIVLACAVAAAVAVGAGAWDVPRVPSGRRTQFYLQRADGGYQYGYDTGAGHSGQAHADAANEVQGQFEYLGADGRAVGVRYSAGQAGYVPQLDGVQVPAAAATSATADAYGAASGLAVQSTDGQLDADYDANADASYSFNIDTDSYKRTEQADARGNVRGQYSYNTASGGSHALSYVAGEGTGFVVTGASPSVSAASAATGRVGVSAAPYSGPVSNTQATSAADGSYSFGYNTNEQSRQESADERNNVRGSYSFRTKEDGKLRRVDYQAGAATGFVAKGDHLPVAPKDTSASTRVSAITATSAAVVPPYSGPLADIRSTTGNDGSYSFAFGTDLQTRQESADAHQNVRGSFSFTAPDDGKTRRVDYQAGPATGFVARGDHLPVAPSVDVTGSAIAYSARYPAPATISASSYSGSASNAQGSENVDGSYSFSYNTDEQSRQESADAKNNVRGSYSFKAKDDGKVRRVDYVAGSSTGFVATGDHLPVAPEVPAAPATPGAVDTVTTYAATSAVVPSSTFSAQNALYGRTATDVKDFASADGSYSFSFGTKDHSRQESADAKNNVRGSFSFTAPDDGQTRHVDYSAGAATGFVAEGAHLPVAPAAPAAPGIGLRSHSSAAPVAPALAHSVPASNAQSSANADGSYSFTYTTRDQSRQESADAQNNVRGSYHFKAKDDGLTRRVDYVAGAATGFVANGDHLPKAPPAPGALGGASADSRAAAAFAYGTARPSANADGTYSFSYNAGDHSRQEAADAAGNVRGSFSFVAKDDAQARRVDYSAGAATGFLASGAHLPVADAGASATSAVATSYSAPTSSAFGAPEESGDASYAYSYQTDTSSKSESSDAQGNVKGEYSYQAGDGATRRITYTARNKEGFVASGDLAPSGAGVSSSVSASAAAASSVLVRAGAVAHSSHSSHPTHSAHSAHGTHTLHDGGAIIKQFLPPQSEQKFGYIYDTKA